MIPSENQQGKSERKMKDNSNVSAIDGYPAFLHAERQMQPGLFGQDATFLQTHHPGFMPHFPGILHPHQYHVPVQAMMNPADMMYSRLREENKGAMYMSNDDERSNISNLIPSPSMQYGQPYTFHEIPQYGYSDEHIADSKAFYNNNRSNHATLGQMAEQVQTKARAEAKARGNNQNQNSLQIQTITQQQQDNNNNNNNNESDNSSSRSIMIDSNLSRTIDEDDGEFETNPSNGSERAGRWTKEEHELFLDALKKYGKEWKKVAAQVKTRTVVQTRTHAQKYFQKIHKSGSGNGNDDSDMFADSLSLRKDSSTKRQRRTMDEPADKRKKGSSGGGGGTYTDSDNDDDDDGSDTGGGGGSGGGSNNIMDDYQSSSSSSMPMSLQPPMAMSMSMSIVVPSSTRSTSSNTSSGYFPHPSPAACGSRKLDELTAAEMLAGTVCEDMDGVQVLVGLRAGGGGGNVSNNNSNSNGHSNGYIPNKSDLKSTTDSYNSNSSQYSNNNSNYSSHNTSRGRGNGNGGFNSSSSSLSILNPDIIGHYRHDEDAPETPWEGELKALGVYPPPSTSTSDSTSTTSKQTSINTSIINNINYYPSLPSDQSDFLCKLREMILQCEVEDVYELLKEGDKKYNKKNNNSGSNNSNSNNEDDNNDEISSNLSSEIESNTTPTATTTRTTTSHHNNSHNNNISSTRTGKISSTSTLLASILNTKDIERGVTVLMLACEIDPTNNHTEDNILKICSYLIEYGISVSDSDHLGWNCLHRTARFGYSAIGMLLLTKGCSVNTTGPNGDAATHIAAKAGHEKFLLFLSNLGANPHIRNIQGQSALDLVGLDIIVGSKGKEKQNIFNEYHTTRIKLRRSMLQCESRLRTLILYHEDCLAHIARNITDWEQPDRLKEIMNKLYDSNNFQTYELEITNSFKKASVEVLSRVHSAEYITFVNELSKQVQDQIDNASDVGAPKPPPLPFTPQIQKFLKHFNTNDLKSSESCDTAFSSGTLKASRRAAGAVAHAIDMILLGRNRNAFCVVRPPGHHAGYSGLLEGGKSCGFCIFNSVCAGAMHALEFHKVERVAIIDLDIHHGNGTEDIVRKIGQPSRLFFFSVHLFDKEHGSGSHGYEFFPGSGSSDDTTHNIINVPIPPIWTTYANNGIPHATRAAKPVVEMNPPTATGREAYRQAISQRLLPSLRAFNPDLILLSTGFDAAHGDVGNVRFQSPTHGSGGSTTTAATANNNSSSVQERGMDLTPADFEWVTTEVLRVADLCCAGRVVSVLEGGYGEYVKPTRTRKGQLATTASSTSTPSDKGSVDETSSSSSSIETTFMDRQLLANSAVAHVRRLVDPYGPTTPHRVHHTQIGQNNTSSTSSSTSSSTAQSTHEITSTSTNTSK